MPLDSAVGAGMECADPWEKIVGEPAIVALILHYTYNDKQWWAYQWAELMAEHIDNFCRNTCSLLSVSRHTYALNGQEAFWHPLREYCFRHVPLPPDRRRRTRPPPLTSQELFTQMCRRNLDFMKAHREHKRLEDAYWHAKNYFALLSNEQVDRPPLPDETPRMQTRIRTLRRRFKKIETSYEQARVHAHHMEKRMIFIGILP